MAAEIPACAVFFSRTEGPQPIRWTSVRSHSEWDFGNLIR